MSQSSRDMDASSSNDAPPTPADEGTSTAQRILKRAELSRITRLLKHRLEIAQYKVERKWQHFSLKSVAPQMEQEVLLASRRQQQQQQGLLNGASLPMSESSTTPPPPLPVQGPGARADGAQDAFQELPITRPGPPASSPPRATEAAFLIPDLPIRSRFQESSVRGDEATAGPSLHAHAYDPIASVGYGVSPRKRTRTQSDEDHDSSDMGRDGSPLKYRAATPASRNGAVGFDHQGLPRTPPPSTPPPQFRAGLTGASRGPSGGRGQATHAASFKDSEEGADLLLYLATSPSPAKARRSRDFLPGPSPRSPGHPQHLFGHPAHGTPHSAHHAHHTSGPFQSPPPLLRASSQVNTPVGGGFNLSEFLNFTPSPAQAAAQHHPALHLSMNGQMLASRLAAAAASASHSTNAAGMMGTPPTGQAYGASANPKVSPIKLTYDANQASPSRAAGARLYGPAREDSGGGGYLEAALGSPSRRASAGGARGTAAAVSARGTRLDYL